MKVNNCKGCGRLFNAFDDERLCPDCLKKLDEKFQNVKRYLEDNPTATIDDVSKENEVTVKQIKQWVREERLTFSEDSLEGLDCELCGAMIRTGKYCEKCKTKIASNLMSAYNNGPAKVQKQKRDGNHMRFLQND